MFKNSILKFKVYSAVFQKGFQGIIGKVDIYVLFSIGRKCVSVNFYRFNHINVRTGFNSRKLLFFGICKAVFRPGG